MYGLLFWTPIARTMEQFSIFRLIDLGRFYFLQPLLWYLLFFWGCSILYEKGKWFRIIVKASLALQIMWLLISNVQIQTFYQSSPSDGSISYQNFYSRSVYSRIKSTLGPLDKNTRFACLGIYPGIAQFNGLHTIDGYVSNYPLSYKKEFREIIQAELKKDASIQKYFDFWGSRCYLFTEQTGKNFLVQQGSNETYKNLELDVNKLNALECKYILSALPIESHESAGFHFMGEFQDPSNPYKVFLYKITALKE